MAGPPSGSSSPDRIPTSTPVRYNVPDHIRSSPPTPWTPANRAPSPSHSSDYESDNGGIFDISYSANFQTTEALAINWAIVFENLMTGSSTPPFPGPHTSFRILDGPDNTEYLHIPYTLTAAQQSSVSNRLADIWRDYNRDAFPNLYAQASLYRFDEPMPDGVDTSEVPYRAIPVEYWKLRGPPEASYPMTKSPHRPFAGPHTSILNRGRYFWGWWCHVPRWMSRKEMEVSEKKLQNECDKMWEWGDRHGVDVMSEEEVKGNGVEEDKEELVRCMKDMAELMEEEMGIQFEEQADEYGDWGDVEVPVWVEQTPSPAPSTEQQEIAYPHYIPGSEAGTPLDSDPDEEPRSPRPMSPGEQAFWKRRSEALHLKEQQERHRVPFGVEPEGFEDSDWLDRDKKESRYDRYLGGSTVSESGSESGARSGGKKEMVKMSDVAGIVDGSEIPEDVEAQGNKAAGETTTSEDGADYFELDSSDRKELEVFDELLANSGVLEDTEEAAVEDSGDDTIGINSNNNPRHSWSDSPDQGPLSASDELPESNNNPENAEHFKVEEGVYATDEVEHNGNYAHPRFDPPDRDQSEAFDDVLLQENTYMDDRDASGSKPHISTGSRGQLLPIEEGSEPASEESEQPSQDYQHALSDGRVDLESSPRFVFPKIILPPAEEDNAVEDSMPTSMEKEHQYPSIQDIQQALHINQPSNISHSSPSTNCHEGQGQEEDSTADAPRSQAQPSGSKLCRGFDVMRSWEAIGDSNRVLGCIEENLKDIANGGDLDAVRKECGVDGSSGESALSNHSGTLTDPSMRPSEENRRTQTREIQAALTAAEHHINAAIRLTEETLREGIQAYESEYQNAPVQARHRIPIFKSAIFVLATLAGYCVFLHIDQDNAISYSAILALALARATYSEAQSTLERPMCFEDARLLTAAVSSLENMPHLALLLAAGNMKALVVCVAGHVLATIILGRCFWPWKYVLRPLMSVLSRVEDAIAEILFWTYHAAIPISGWIFQGVVSRISWIYRNLTTTWKTLFPREFWTSVRIAEDLGLDFMVYMFGLLFGSVGLAQGGAHNYGIPRLCRLKKPLSMNASDWKALPYLALGSAYCIVAWLICLHTEGSLRRRADEARGRKWSSVFEMGLLALCCVGSVGAGVASAVWWHC